jgi:RNA polymerase sigma factor (sigma-70 family)
MKTGGGAAVVRRFQQLLEPGTVAGLSDSQVFARFIESRDPIAFEAIVDRHGPMVRAVCRRILGDPGDADDAFQATFLIFIKRAVTLRQPERLGAWLYGVAYRVARRVRTARTTTGLPEHLAATTAACPAEESERISAVLDEINGLPEKYRLPIVLCCLEERTRSEAAAHLNWPVGTVDGRLARARELLRSRLERRGICVSGGASELLALIHRSELFLPEVLRRTTIALLSGAAPSRLETLLKGALVAMVIDKLKWSGTACALALVGTISVCSTFLVHQAPARSQDTAQPKPAIGAIATGGDSNALSAAYPAPDPQPNQRGAEDEHDADALESLQVDAELLEVEVESLRKRIPLQILEIETFRRRAPEVDTRRAPGDAEAERFNTIKRWIVRLEADKEEYRSKRLALARMKRRIARQGGPANTAPTASPSTASPSMRDVLRRLDRIESQLDELVRTAKRKTIR